ncbi:MAG: hypothetical protein II852_04735 [Bacteroidales bacterium]|nr:hypothetical protein [Bacteroidales bacterium]
MKKIFRMAAFMLALGSMTAGFTSCGEDDGTEEGGTTTPTAEEQLKLNEIVATAQKDGKITIAGTIVANTKIKTFELQDLDGKTIVDLMDEQSKSKGEDGKEFTLTLKSTSVPVQKMQLVIKTRGNKEVKEAIGADYSFELGYGANSTLGSYVSMVEQKSYTQEEVEASADVAAKVEFVLGDDDLKPASQARNAQEGKVNYGKYAKSAIYEGTIITDTGCIATYTLQANADGKNGTLSGVVINSKGTLKIQPAEDVQTTK